MSEELNQPKWPKLPNLGDYHEELKPCPFCGKPNNTQFLIEGSVYCECDDLVCMPVEKWNSASCWKEIDSLRQRLKEAEEGMDVLVGASSLRAQSGDALNAGSSTCDTKESSQPSVLENLLWMVNVGIEREGLSECKVRLKGAIEDAIAKAKQQKI